jgi:hypothetical protein
MSRQDLVAFALRSNCRMLARISTTCSAAPTPIAALAAPTHRPGGGSGATTRAATNSKTICDVDPPRSAAGAPNMTDDG